jgi:hypothetical protein
MALVAHVVWHGGARLVVCPGCFLNGGDAAHGRLAEATQDPDAQDQEPHRPTVHDQAERARVQSVVQLVNFLRRAKVPWPQWSFSGPGQLPTATTVQTTADAHTGNAPVHTPHLLISGVGQVFQRVDETGTSDSLYGSVQQECNERANVPATDDLWSLRGIYDAAIDPGRETVYMILSIAAVLPTLHRMADGKTLGYLAAAAILAAFTYLRTANEGRTRTADAAAFARGTLLIIGAAGTGTGFHIDIALAANLAIALVVRTGGRTTIGVLAVWLFLAPTIEAYAEAGRYLQREHPDRYPHGLGTADARC